MFIGCSKPIADIPLDDRWLSAKEAFDMNALLFTKRRSELALGTLDRKNKPLQLPSMFPPASRASKSAQLLQACLKLISRTSLPGPVSPLVTARARRFAQSHG